MAHIDARGNFTSGHDLFNVINGTINVHSAPNCKRSSVGILTELITICYQVPESKPPPTPGLTHEFERVSRLNVDGYTPDVAIFSPDGTHIISCSDKPAIAIWNTDTDALVFGPLKLTPENGGPHDVEFVALSRNGERMCSGPRSRYGGGGGDNIMRVWDVTTGREILTPTPLDGGADRVTHAALSHDGTKLVTASYHRIRVWDIQTATSTIGSGAHGGSIFPISLSHDGKRFASAGQYDKRINIWDIDKVTVAYGPHTDHASNGDVKSFAFSPDGKKIVMGFDNGKILLIDAKDGDIINQPEKFSGHTGWITSLAFAPDGKWIVSGSLDGSVRVWETDTGLPTCKPLKGHMNGIRSISVSSDGRKIVSNSGQVVLVWVLQQ